MVTSANNENFPCLEDIFRKCSALYNEESLITREFIVNKLLKIMAQLFVKNEFNAQEYCMLHSDFHHKNSFHL